MKFNIDNVIKMKSNLYKIISCGGGLYKVKCIKFLEVENLGDGILCNSVESEIWISDFICWKFNLVSEQMK